MCHTAVDGLVVLLVSCCYKEDSSSLTQSVQTDDMSDDEPDDSDIASTAAISKPLSKILRAKSSFRKYGSKSGQCVYKMLQTTWILESR